MTSLIQRDFGSPRKRESTGSNASSYLLLLNSLATDLDCMLSELCTTPDSYERMDLGYCITKAPGVDAVWADLYNEQRYCHRCYPHFPEGFLLRLHSEWHTAKPMWAHTNRDLECTGCGERILIKRSTTKDCHQCRQLWFRYGAMYKQGKEIPIRPRRRGEPGPHGTRH